jgi:hypothetical protein
MRGRHGDCLSELGGTEVGGSAGGGESGFWCDNSLPHEEKRESLELFIKEVVPAFQ